MWETRETPHDVLANIRNVCLWLSDRRLLWMVEELGMTTLLPCPFCGSTNIDPEGWASTERAGPACDDCAGTADTVALWNRRPVTAAEMPKLSDLAAVIHDARFGPDYPPHLVNPFEREGMTGQEYCYRLARAVMTRFRVSARPVSPSDRDTQTVQRETET
jgi:hypothetical protein